MAPCIVHLRRARPTLNCRSGAKKKWRIRIEPDTRLCKDCWHQYQGLATVHTVTAHQQNCQDHPSQQHTNLSCKHQSPSCQRKHDMTTSVLQGRALLQQENLDAPHQAKQLSNKLNLRMPYRPRGLSKPEELPRNLGNYARVQPLKDVDPGCGSFLRPPQDGI
jgi:hypothetical protein